MLIPHCSLQLCSNNIISSNNNSSRIKQPSIIHKPISLLCRWVESLYFRFFFPSRFILSLLLLKDWKAFVFIIVWFLTLKFKTHSMYNSSYPWQRAMKRKKNGNFAADANASCAASSSCIGREWPAAAAGLRAIWSRSGRPLGFFAPSVLRFTGVAAGPSRLVRRQVHWTTLQ